MAETEIGAIDHMHEDHLDALQAIYTATTGRSAPGTLQMLSIFQEGFHLSTNEKPIFVEYEQELMQASDLRHAMVVLTQQSRGGFANHA